MRGEKELETEAERIYWLVERGEMTEAVRKLQALQKEGMKEAKDFVRDDRRKSYELIDREMAKLPC